MLTPSEYTILYNELDAYLSSDAFKASFMKPDQSGIDYESIILFIDEAICENYAYPNPNKIKDRVKVLNGKNDFNKALAVFKNKKDEVLKTIKYFDLPK
jgi:hypothetical protein